MAITSELLPLKDTSALALMQLRQSNKDADIIFALIFTSLLTPFRRLLLPVKALNQVVLAGSLSGLLESVGQVILIKHRVASLKHCAEQLLALGKTVYDMKLRFGELGLL